MKAKIGIPDVSTFDVVMAGFRKAAAPTTCAAAANVITAYSDTAVLNCNQGDIFTGVRLATGTGTLTDTTLNMADDDVAEFTVKVSAAGVVTFEVDGVAPPEAGTLTLAADTIVIPFIQVTRDETGDTDIPIIEKLTVGYQ
jgi:hypothetical protein